MIHKTIENDNKKLIIFFSGGSQKRFETLFNPDHFKHQYDIYEVIPNLENTTFEKIITLINQQLQPHLSKYTHTIAICKSFGGVISLLTNLNFTQYIFLASPIITGTPTISHIINKNTNTIQIKDIIFSPQTLHQKNIHIIQGTKDKEKFQTISKNLQENLNLPITYLNTTHSFDNVKEELEETILKIIK